MKPEIESLLKNLQPSGVAHEVDTRTDALARASLSDASFGSLSLGDIRALNQTDPGAVVQASAEEREIKVIKLPDGPHTPTFPEGPSGGDGVEIGYGSVWKGKHIEPSTDDE